MLILNGGGCYPKETGVREKENDGEERKQIQGDALPICHSFSRK